jgi:hypothetical protein
MNERAFDHDSLLKLLEPEQFARLTHQQREQVISHIGPNPEPELLTAKRRAIAALRRHVPGFNPIY